MPGQYHFPRRERLTRKQDFLAVYQEGARYAGSAFVFYVARRESQGRKFGIAVSRRVGKAVVRNRVKRYLREFYRRHRTQFPEDVQIVCVARPEAAEFTCAQCHDAMRRTLEQKGVLHG